jgi:hypothetical protein
VPRKEVYSGFLLSEQVTFTQIISE